jgi:hypothetical protein
MSRMLRRSLALAVVLVPVASLPAAEPIPPEKFDQIHELIQPKDEEQTWARIPWRTSLWEARVEAAREGKPILLWEMDGHPLGCT